jgi:hypothetical protein
MIILNGSYNKIKKMNEFKNETINKLKNNNLREIHLSFNFIKNIDINFFLIFDKIEIFNFSNNFLNDLPGIN